MPASEAAAQRILLAVQSTLAQSQNPRFLLRRSTLTLLIEVLSLAEALHWPMWVLHTAFQTTILAEAVKEIVTVHNSEAAFVAMDFVAVEEDDYLCPDEACKSAA